MSFTIVLGIIPTLLSLTMAEFINTIGQKKNVPPKGLLILSFLLFIGVCAEIVFAFWIQKPTITPLPVKVLVMTMFTPEMKPWLKNEKIDYTITVPGAYDKLYCDKAGLCVTMLGKSKANASASMMAILLSPFLSLKDTYFISVGIAGTKPTTGTLGFAAWARWVVDWDQGSHLLEETVPNVPFGYTPDIASDSTAFHLNEKLANLAFTITEKLPLADSDGAIKTRQNYPGQADKHPFVSLCDTIAGDDFWSGTELSDTADYVMSKLTDNKGLYCTTEQEDVVIASVLHRMGYLDKYLSLRTASNFDQPYPGQSMDSLFSQFSAGDIAIANAYLVGSTMAHYLSSHPTDASIASSKVK